jgi:hypothetical protein
MLHIAKIDHRPVAVACLDGFLAAVNGPAFARQPRGVGAQAASLLQGFMAGSKCRGILDGSEHGEQVVLFRYLDLIAPLWPELVRCIYAVPNGGKRGKLTAAKLKQEGVRAGIPDICVPYASHPHASLRIELKRADGGTVSKEQSARAADLESLGNLVLIARGWEPAARAIVDYVWPTGN